MAGLDCAIVSPAAWPSLLPGIRGTITVSDVETHAAMRELAAAGLAIGESGAAPLAALPALPDSDVDADSRAADRHRGPEPALPTTIAGRRPPDPPQHDAARGRDGGVLVACCSSWRRCRRSRSCSSPASPGCSGSGPAIFLVASALAAVPAGRLMDRIGRRPVIAGGYLPAAAGCALTALATNVELGAAR